MVNWLPLKQLIAADRQRYIDLRLRFLGSVRRQDLVARFGIQTAAATRDIADYRSYEGKRNVQYCASDKSYYITEDFETLFPQITVEQVLDFLIQRPGYGGNLEPEELLPIEMPSHQSLINLDTLALITRSINLRKGLTISYRSIEIGLTTRSIVPHALINLGDQWLVRAFDRQSHCFGDFVIGRIQDAEEMDTPPSPPEQAEQDKDWNSTVQLELVAHPNNVKHPESLEKEYQIIKGVLRLRTRAATAGYLLKNMFVDCSEKHKLKGPAYQWWLQNRRVLEGLPNIDFAPGYL